MKNYLELRRQIPATFAIHKTVINALYRALNKALNKWYAYYETIPDNLTLIFFSTQ